MQRARGLLRVLLALTLLLGAAIALVTQPVLVLRFVSPEERARPALLREHVRRLVQEHAPRDRSHPDNLARAAAYIAGSLRAAGLSVREQRYTVGKASYSNVIAELGPDTEERVVIGAHYDAWENAGGADDNGSGVAALLELGRLLRGARPKLRIELVAYTLEEPPSFMTEAQGSRQHVHALLADGKRVRAMLALETLGFYSTDENSQHYPGLIGLLYPSRGDFVAVVSDLSSIGLTRRVKRDMRLATGTLDVRSANAPRAIPGVDYSDHAPYLDAGFPAVMITDTAFYRNPHYHEVSDQPGSLDYDRMSLVVDGVHAAVRDLAEDPITY